MAKRTAVNGTRIIDPNLFIPDGMEGWEYDESALYGDIDETDDEVEETEPEEEILRPPNFLNVVSQTVRTKKNGTQVVDMVVEVEDVPGAVRYELRVTKA